MNQIVKNDAGTQVPADDVRIALAYVTGAPER